MLFYVFGLGLVSAIHPENIHRVGFYTSSNTSLLPDCYTCSLSDVLRFACSVSCSPVPEITWRRANGVPFPSKVKMKYSNAVLEIPSFQQDDTGGYECVAENKMGKNTAAGRLAFYGTPLL